MEELADDVKAGQATYTRSFLSVYDLLVLRFSNNYIWKCPTANMLEMYDRYLSTHHLDVGVGTGYFLLHTNKLRQCKKLTLLDVNTNSLKLSEHKLRRKGRVAVETIAANILGDIPAVPGQFNSVGINYLLHCLPGRIDEKLSRVIENIKPCTTKGCILFGSTILTGDVQHSATARRVLNLYNRRGIFSNHGDTAARLSDVLAESTKNHDVKIVGGVALFSASM